MILVYSYKVILIYMVYINEHTKFTGLLKEKKYNLVFHRKPKITVKSLNSTQLSVFNVSPSKNTNDIETARQLIPHVFQYVRRDSLNQCRQVCPKIVNVSWYRRNKHQIFDEAPQKNHRAERRPLMKNRILGRGGGVF